MRQKLRLTGEKALLGFEPRISCLLDRHFDQLSHSTTFCGKTDVQTLYEQDKLGKRQQKLWLTKSGEVTGNTTWLDKLVEIRLTKSEERHKLRLTGEKALLGFEPRISCLLDRHFDQLSHSTTFCGKTDVQTLYDRSNYQKLWLTKSEGRQKATLDWGKGTAGIWTQDLLFTRQALWPTKPHRLYWMGKVTGNSIWLDKLVEMKLTKPEGRQKLSLTGEKALLGFEPRISCLLDRHFDQLSHSTASCGKTDVQTLYDRTN